MKNISKYILSFGLALVLVGCLAEVEDPTGESNATFVTLESGETLTMIEGTPDESQDPTAWTEHAFAAADEGFAPQSCSVTLLTCHDPNTGGPTCNMPGCSLFEGISQCMVLVNRYC